MAGGFGQYLKDTRTELRHVAWPTRTQTIVYSILVAAISIGVSFYLGAFDLFFRASLAHVVNNLPAGTPSAQTSPITVTQTPATTSPVK